MGSELRGVLKKVSRTLYLSFNILPEPVRTRLGTAYLLCRAMDAVTDAAGVSASGRLEALNLMRGLDTPGNAARLEALLRNVAPSTGGAGESELLYKIGKVLAVYERFGGQEKEMFSALLGGVASGLEADIRNFPGGAPVALPTAADLADYSGRLGGSAGAFWARVYRDAIRESAPAYGELPSEDMGAEVGAALQMTGILRDIPEDLRLGRCYLPQEELDAAGLKPADLLDPANMPRLRDIASRWIGWALDRLDRREAFLQSIPKTELAMRAAVIWPVYWAMETLEEIAHSNLLDPAARPRIRRSRIYATIASTPPLLLSNTAFSRGYRFRRETLVVSMNGGNFEGRAL